MTTLTLGTNSYADQAEADAYSEQFGLDTITDDIYLIRATSWVDRMYAYRFIGYKATAAQPLNWPRSPYYNVDSASGVVLDSDGNPIDLATIPTAIKHAVIEVAVEMQNSVDYYSQPTPAVVEEANAVDVLQSSKKYASPFRSKVAGDADLYKVELILRPVLKPTGAISLVR